MKKNTLRQKLIQINAPNDLYSLNGGLPNEAICLNCIGSKWEVYYSERGIKTGLKFFESEESACDYFYNLILEELKEIGLLD